jgi:hypothetical protein
MQHFGELGAAFFWLGVFGVAIVAILTPAIRHREVQKTLRKAIEQGQTVDPALIETVLKGDPPPEQPAVPIFQGFLIGGCITMAAGIGLCVLGLFLAARDHVEFHPLVAVSIMVMLIATALLILSRILKPRPGE